MTDSSAETPTEDLSLFREAFDAVGEAILVFDSHSGEILVTNQAAIDLYRYPPEELRGMRIYDLCERGDKWSNQTRGCKPSVPFMERHVTRDGVAFPVDVSVGHLGHSQRSAMSVRDLTEQQRAEDEREGLEQRLLQAQKMDAIGRLAGGIAHDFNNLLVVILGGAEYLSEVLDKASSEREEADAILSAGIRAEALTRQLLAFSRQKPSEPGRVAVNRSIAGMERLLCRVLGDDVQVLFEVDTKPAWIDATEDHLSQVLLNLAINARDAMPEGGVISVRTGTLPRAPEPMGMRWGSDVDWPCWFLGVGDSGSGMSQDVIRQIFEPFFTTKAAGAGTGLGLATVYGVVQEWGGCIDVESIEGSGTVFRLYVPLVNGPDQHDAEVEEKATVGSETILLVEDEAAVRRVVRRMLVRHGYRVLDSGDGVEALEVAQSYEGTIHCLLTDVVMPKLSGPSLAARLKGENPDLQVLYMSGYNDHPALQGGITRDPVHFLAKPFSEENLILRLQKSLSAVDSR